MSLNTSCPHTCITTLASPGGPQRGSRHEKVYEWQPDLSCLTHTEAVLEWIFNNTLYFWLIKSLSAFKKTVAKKDDVLKIQTDAKISFWFRYKHIYLWYLFSVVYFLGKNCTKKKCENEVRIYQSHTKIQFRIVIQIRLNKYKGNAILILCFKLY